MLRLRARIKKEATTGSDGLQAENRKLKKKVAKLQKKLDKVGLALTEPSSDEEDDDESDE